MPETLYSQRFENPDRPPLVILHGLFGSSRNWTTAARSLAASFDVHVVDLRNHGASPHAPTMHWSEMVDDLEDWMEAAGIGSATVIGHSLGGKVAIRFACEHPGRVDRLVVLDIAARDYPPYHARELSAMRGIDPARLESRREAEAALAEEVDDWAMRQFLLTNLVRDPESGGFRWQINLEAIAAAHQTLAATPVGPGHRYDGPALLLCGETSNFVRPEDPRAMQQYLPMVETMVVPGAGHNLHIDQREALVNAVVSFARRT